MIDQMVCVRCSAPATVCAECMRATALMWFDGIARHPESGTDCKLCAQGLASYCGNCFVEEVVGYRAALREAGNPVIGEPSFGWRVMTPPDSIDERTIALIADRVAAALRKEIEDVAAELAERMAYSQALTVDDVAQRFGVTRSTVYAHWREWGGYKLGESEKAPIRFGATALPTSPSSKQSPDSQAAKRPMRRRRRDLISDAPRFDQPVEELG